MAQPAARCGITPVLTSQPAVRASPTAWSSSARAMTCGSTTRRLAHSSPLGRRAAPSSARPRLSTAASTSAAPTASSMYSRRLRAEPNEEHGLPADVGPAARSLPACQSSRVENARAGCCSRASIGTAKQPVRGLARIEHLACTLDAGNWQSARVEKAELYQHGGLVPIDVLVRQLSVPEVNDHDQRHLDSPSRGSDARQHPVHADGMSELEDHLIDQLIVPDGPRDGNQLRVRGHLRNETFGVELPQLLTPNAPRQHRDVVDIGVVHHRCESIFDTACDELVADMFLPDIMQALLRTRKTFGRG